MVALRLPLVALVSNLLPRSWLLLSLWLSFNGLIYWNTYRSYKGQPQYYYLYRMLGSGLCMSRGTGAVLNVSCCLVLLPVCQWTGTLMRTLAVRVSPYLVRLLMNQAKMLHTTCAVTILVASAVHTGAHLANAFHFSRHYNPIWTEINVADYPNQDPLEMVVTTVPGITGLLMVLILAALALTATSCFRRRHYNVFYYIHLLYAPFLLLLIFHPLSGMMKEQVNIEEHVPGCDPEGMWPNRSSSSNTKNNSTHCLTAPIFVSMSTRTWVWVSIPLALYLADLGIRRWKRHQAVDISRVVFHQGDILELHVNKWMPKCFPGQYVLLQCVDISAFEWHPFSLSSCCDLTHPQWTVHIKTSGDWCTRLRDLLIARQYGESRKLKLYVDGPFGGPIADALRSKIVVFIAGGIGISPYLSVVQHLIRNGWPSRPKRLHLIWIVPKIEHLWWAAAPFVQLIEDVWSSSVPDKLEVSFHVTRTPVKDCRDLSSANLLRTTYPSVFHRVHSGRPDWTQLFSIWTDIYRGESVKVFSCGPKKLNRQIRKLCSRQDASKTSFTFIHEHFS